MSNTGENKNGSDPPKPLDAGLQAAFGLGSVLESLAPRLGDRGKVLLREEETGQGSPVIDPRAAEAAGLTQGRGKIGWALRRLQSPRLRRRLFAHRLAAAVIDCRPDLIYAVTPEAVAVAEHAAARCGAAVVRDPRFPDAGERDIVRLAPDHVDVSSSPAGAGSTNHTPSDTRESWIPLPQRHAGMVAIVAYRETETTPGRYLLHAMERAGIEVRHIGDRLDWGTVDAKTAFVLFVR